MAKLSAGKAIKIVIPQNIVENEGISWIHVYIDKTLIYPDKPIETLFLNYPTIDYRKIEGEFNGTTKSVDYIDIWGGPGNYPRGQQKDGNGRYKVAISSKIIYPKYPDDGKVEAEDFNGFSKNITVYLKKKVSGA